MGNSTGAVDDSLKAQAGGANGPVIELYKFINVEGGGELLRLQKIANNTKDYTMLDNMIRNEVKNFLYNDGQGKDIPIEKIILKRTNGRLVSLKYPDKSANFPKTMTCCFKIDKLGAVGENIVHNCMLCGTDDHIQLAKRLIKFYPKLVNDIYLSNEYYGESALHMAIVNEEVSFVRFLLMYGADVHRRAYGRFLCPDDQKNGRVDYIDSELIGFPINTSYENIGPYYGEYPLSFAAILNQPDCIRILIAKGADPNMQDSNGNTVLHMLVIHDNLEMFKLMLEFDVKLDIKNHQGLTPLTLAAKLARKEMFQFILKQQRHFIWCYADVVCVAYPLETVDTIGHDGQTDTTSALYLIANGKSIKHLELLEGLVIDMFNRKWSTYVKQRFYREVIIFLVYFLLSIVVVVLQRASFDALEEIHCLEYSIDNHNIHLNETNKECACLFGRHVYKWRTLQTVLEITQMIYSLVYLFLFSTELYIQRFQLYSKTLLFNPSKVIFILSILLTLLIIPMRLTCTHSGEDYLIVLSIILKPTYILYLGRGFRFITTFVYIIHQVIKTNFLRFLIIILIFMFGFSQSFYIVYGFGEMEGKKTNGGSGEKVFRLPLLSFFDIFIMSLNDLLDSYNYLRIQKYATIGKILFVVYVICVGILLINLLIAMMANTYDITTGLKREWLRQWAQQVLVFEQNISLRKRLKEQIKYMFVAPNGEKFFMVKEKQTAEDRERIKSEKNYCFNQWLYHRAVGVTKAS